MASFGNILVTSTGGLQEYQTDGTFVGTSSGGGVHMAWDRNLNLYGTTGAFTPGPGGDDDNCAISGIAVAPDGSAVYMGYSNTARREQGDTQRRLGKWVGGIWVADVPTTQPLEPDGDGGVFAIDMSPDGCTVVFTNASFDEPGVIRASDGCALAALADIGTVGGEGPTDIKVLPNGDGYVTAGALFTDGVRRLNAGGSIVWQHTDGRTWWGVALDVDGVHVWAHARFDNPIEFTRRIAKFNLDTGNMVFSFDPADGPVNFGGTIGNITIVRPPIEDVSARPMIYGTIVG